MWKNSLDALWVLLKRHRGRIFYYGGLVLVLTAIAFAADSYRRSAPEALVVPSAEVSAVLERLREPEIVYPEGMRLLNGFSTQPRWNDALQQWESHEAADYSLADNDVICLEGGIVRAVGETGLHGGYLEVECCERLYRYASIFPSESMAAGKEVRAGDRIGTADESMAGEQSLGAHLHLELYENGNATVDFQN